MNQFTIANISAREILDSRGNPTIETSVTLNNGVNGVAMIPSGASTGMYEACELRDGDKKRYGGKGVLNAVNNVNTTLKNALIGFNANNQAELDALMIKLDGTQNKSRLGANAILGVSLATAKAVAKANNLELYEYIGKRNNYTLPVPMCNIINGGEHASNTIDIQEFMIMPVGALTFAEGIRWCAEIFHSLKSVLKSKGLGGGVGDEGGFAPNLKTAEEALDCIVEATEKAGYTMGSDIKIAIDAAATGWASTQGGYLLPKSGKRFSTDELIDYWVNLVKKYPIISLEDPLDENDYIGFAKLTALLGSSVQVVGDDLYVTNTERLAYGIEHGCSNSVLIKLNQIGTLTETLQAIAMAHKANYTTVISHRSGETEDTVIADLAVATNSTQIKTGSLCRSERVAKYNRLMGIEQNLGTNGKYAGNQAFGQLKK